VQEDGLWGREGWGRGGWQRVAEGPCFNGLAVKGALVYTDIHA